MLLLPFLSLSLPKFPCRHGLETLSQGLFIKSTDSLSQCSGCLMEPPETWTITTGSLKFENDESKDPHTRQVLCD